jgi:photosystem II stability/assembly factor-like uncharacterized protein
MKKIILVFVISCSFFISGNLCSQWIWQNPLPHGATINCIKFVNNNTGWIVGENGIIMKTTNFGSSWINQISGTSNSIISSSFYDANTGWALTPYSQLLRTTNGGGNWILTSLFTSNYPSIFFLNQSTGWIGGFNRVLKTTNGGINWTEIFVPINYYSRTIFFPDSINGYITAQNSLVYKSTNGGLNWFSVSNGLTTFTDLYSSYFIDSITGYIGGLNGLVFKTTNGGNNWNPVSIGTTSSITSLYFISHNTGWAVTDAGNIYKTTTGGSFTLQQSGTTTGLNSVCFINNNTGYTTGKFGTLLYTTNSGSQWIQRNQTITNNTLFSSCFINSQTGWVGGDNFLAKTINGGDNWSQYTISIPNTSINSIYFVNQNTGYAGGSYGPVYKTTDCGLNWFNYGVQSSYPSAFVHFVDSDVGWLANGKVLKTTNGGVNWLIQFDSSNINFEKLYFSNLQTGWIVGISIEGYFNPRSRIYTTTNGGLNWALQFNQPYNRLKAIKFIDNLTGWAIGGYEDNDLNINFFVAYKTTNGGITWLSKGTSSINYSMESFSFFDSATVVCAGKNGTIVKTTNDGNNWAKLESSTVNNLHSISVVKPNLAWVVGDGGSILKTINGGVLTYFSISGLVRYSDNNQPATNGYVKAFKLDGSTGNIITYDSVQIQANGSYTLSNVPQDSVDIGVYPNSTTQNDYVITYYPSTTYWQNATTLYPTGNLTNINIGAIRMSPVTAGNSVNGKVMRLTDAQIGNLKDAVLYAKNGNTFVRCAVSDENGVYHLPSLPTGNLKIICNRIGFTNDSAMVNVTPTGNIDSINFHLYRIPVGIKQISEIVPSEYKLYQNYPNPFNPSTIIRFQIKDSRHGGSSTNVKLIVYDILGREIITLVNEKLQAGTYEIPFSINSITNNRVSSGIYFYTLTAGDFKATKRFVLIK